MQVPDEMDGEVSRQSIRRRNSGVNPTGVTISSPITRNTSLTSVSPISLPNTGHNTSTRPKPRQTLQSILYSWTLKFPTFVHVFLRLPLPLLPFAFSMFILVEALSFVGWIRVFGGWWASWVDVAGLGGAVFLMAVLSVLGCNVSF